MNMLEYNKIYKIGNFLDYKNDLPLNCPDSQIKEIHDSKRFYRVTHSVPPLDDDFIPTWHLGYKNRPECPSKGISIFEKLEDSIAAMKQFKKLGKYIYSGIIRYKVDGIVQLTPTDDRPSHRTWYPYQDTDEKAIFQVREK